MAEVKVLIEGIHELSPDNVLDVYCTTTLIKSDINIIVDPGSFISQKKLLQVLDAEGLHPSDIQAVILTHLHLDHTANIGLFSKAKIYLHHIGGKYVGQYQQIDQGKVYRYDLLNQPIAPGVRIIETQGHTSDSITVLVETEQGVVAICGDAIASEQWTNLNKKPDSNMIYSMEKYDESRKKILGLADWIIPGHGGMFKVNI